MIIENTKKTKEIESSRSNKPPWALIICEKSFIFRYLFIIEKKASPLIAAIGSRIITKILNNKFGYILILKSKFKKIKSDKISPKIKEKIKPSIDFLGENLNFTLKNFLPKSEPKK